VSAEQVGYWAIYGTIAVVLAIITWRKKR